MHPLLLLPAVCGLVSTAAMGADWPHYRGPAQNGSSVEKIAAFPLGGPRELWRVQLGTGLASATVTAGRVWSAGYLDKKEVLHCLDAASGKTVWTYSWPAKLGDYLFEGGPRATPTVDGGRVFMLGADGHLACVNAATGKPVWEKDLVRDFGGRRPDWGFSGSPTVSGGLVIVDAGGKGASTIALAKETGALAWKSGDDEPGYGSAVVADLQGRKTALLLKAGALVGYDAARGGELWRFDWETSFKVNAATPLVVGDKVVISAAYRHGAAAVRIAGGKAAQVWFSRNLKAHFNSPVHLGGYVYGIDGEAGKKSALVCLDLATGDEKWRAPSVNGSLILAGDKLLALSEAGDLILADAAPQGYREIARKKVIGGRCWVQPALANGKVWCRNNTGELVALDLGSK